MKGIFISFLPTPMTKTLPPNFTAWMAPLMEDSTPVHSIAVRGIRDMVLVSLAGMSLTDGGFNPHGLYYL